MDDINSSALDKLKEEMYKEKNYKEIIVDKTKNICYIFFSSNAIYYPNTEESFRKTIIENNRYEWENLANSKEIRKKAGKMIFLRDIYKCFYAIGINNSINSIDKLINFIKDRTKGYKVITVGNSAGGYMAMLMGTVIGAQAVFSFAGQVSLYDNDNVIEKYKILNECKDNPRYNKYFDIRQYNNLNVDIFYFYAAKCNGDIIQKKLCEKYENIHMLGFNSNIHGVTMFSANMPYVLALSNNELKKIFTEFRDVYVSRQKFYIYTKGIFKFCMMFINKIFNMGIRK